MIESEYKHMYCEWNVGNNTDKVMARTCIYCGNQVNRPQQIVCHGKPCLIGNLLHDIFGLCGITPKRIMRWKHGLKRALEFCTIGLFKAPDKPTPCKCDYRRCYLNNLHILFKKLRYEQFYSRTMACVMCLRYLKTITCVTID